MDSDVSGDCAAAATPLSTAAGARTDAAERGSGGYGLASSRPGRLGAARRSSARMRRRCRAGARAASAGSRTRRHARRASRRGGRRTSPAAACSQASDSEPSRSTVAPALARDLQHRRVLAQRMDEHRLARRGCGRAAWRARTGVDRSRAGAPWAAPRRRTPTPPPRPRAGSAARWARCARRDQLEAAVEDAEDLVLVEVDRVDVAADLGVGGGVAEAKVARALVEGDQVRGDAVAVARAERADRHPGPAARRALGGARAAADRAATRRRTRSTGAVDAVGQVGGVESRMRSHEAT